MTGLNNREKRERAEALFISSSGVLAANSKGRVYPEEECAVRTCFQRDIDKIIHCKSFRRLKHKTQVFLQPEGDHYRTRLTHTLEVSRIARTIARALELNEDLTEAIALGHDLGHTPFGHAGERALNQLMKDVGGFRHYEQSLRVVDKLEKSGKGLNLTEEVRDGIVRHTNDPLAKTAEGQVVRMADRIAYINHDVDDAIRAGIMNDRDIPDEIVTALGSTPGQRIDTFVNSTIESSMGQRVVTLSGEIYFVMESFHNFMYEKVYKNPMAKSEESKVLGMLEGIFEYYAKDINRLPQEYRSIAENEGVTRAIGDYISGMTDKYAVDVYGKIFIPAAWTVR